MDAREVCFLIGKDDEVLWSDASRSPVALPDSRERWEAIWSRREDILEIAHTHPLGGARFSNEDLTTMEALDSALGRKLVYSVVTPTKMLRRTPDGEAFADAIVEAEPPWVNEIRRESNIPASSETEGDPKGE